MQKPFMYVGNTLSALLLFFILLTELKQTGLSVPPVITPYHFSALLLFAMVYFLSILRTKSDEQMAWTGISLGMLTFTSLLAWGNGAFFSPFALTALSFMLIISVYVILKTKNVVIGALLPLEIIALLYQSSHLLKYATDLPLEPAYLLIGTFFLFLFGYAVTKPETLPSLKLSAFSVSLLHTALLFILSITGQHKIYLPIIALLFAVMLTVADLKLSRSNGDFFLLKYIIPFALWISLSLIPYAYPFDVAILPYLLYTAFAVFAVHFILPGRLSSFQRAFFHTGSVLSAGVFAFTFLSNAQSYLLGSFLPFQSHTLLYSVTAFALYGIVLLCCLFLSKTVTEKIIWLYVTLASLPAVIYHGCWYILINYQQDFTKYAFYLAGFLILAVYWFIKPPQLQKHTTLFLTFLTLILITGNHFTARMLWYEYLAQLLYALLICAVLMHNQLDALTVVPLVLTLMANSIFLYSMEKSLLSSGILLAYILLLSIIGKFRYPTIFTKKIDWFSLFAFANLFFLPYRYPEITNAQLSAILPGALAVIWFAINRKRILLHNNQLGNTALALITLWPYYSLLSTYALPVDIRLSLYTLPLVILTYVCTKGIFRNTTHVLLRVVQYLVPCSVYVLLLIQLLLLNSMTEAVILSSFGFVSLLYGLILKSKSPLFLGGALLLASIVIKTSDFWTSIAWWIYLLALGILLILIASLNEFSKNRSNEDILQRAGRGLDRFSDWD